MVDERALYPQILAEYTKSGGVVVIGGVFPSMEDGSQVATLLWAFDLSWRKRSCLSHEMSDHSLYHDIEEQLPSISKSYSLEAVTLKGVDRDAVQYTGITELGSGSGLA